MACSFHCKASSRFAMSTATLRRAHSLIWAGGRRDPLVALLLLVSSARGSCCFYFCSACSSATTTPKEFSICWVDNCRAAS